MSFRSQKKEYIDENNYARPHRSRLCRRAFGPRPGRIEPFAGSLASSDCIREANRVSFRYECFGYDREDCVAFAKTERLAVGLAEIIPG